MIIHDSDINIESLKNVKNLSDLKKLKIFSHLPNEDEANEDLWKALKPIKVKEVSDLPEDEKID